jgi:hypothetical protein
MKNDPNKKFKCGYCGKKTRPTTFGACLASGYGKVCWQCSEKISKERNNSHEQDNDPGKS